MNAFLLPGSVDMTKYRHEFTQQLQQKIAKLEAEIKALKRINERRFSYYAVIEFNGFEFEVGCEVEYNNLTMEASVGDYQIFFLEIDVTNKLSDYEKQHLIDKYVQEYIGEITEK